MQLLILQAIDSSTGPGESLRDALWETGNTINQTHVLWHDPVHKWAPGVAYHWRLQHNPDSGRIRVRWYQVSFIKSTLWLQFSALADNMHVVMYLLLQNCTSPCFTLHNVVLLGMLFCQLVYSVVHNFFRKTNKIKNKNK